MHHRLYIPALAAALLLSWEWAKMTAPGAAKWMAAAVAIGIMVPGLTAYLADISLALVLLARSARPKAFAALPLLVTIAVTMNAASLATSVLAAAP